LRSGVEGAAVDRHTDQAERQRASAFRAGVYCAATASAGRAAKVRRAAVRGRPAGSIDARRGERNFPVLRALIDALEEAVVGLVVGVTPVDAFGVAVRLRIGQGFRGYWSRYKDRDTEDRRSAKD
jgi:hypothetical protein